MDYELTSARNPRLKHVAKLRDRAYRHKHSQFVVEGKRLVSRALNAGMTPVEVFATSALDWIEATTVSPDVLDGVSYRKQSEEVIAVFPLIETGTRALSELQEGVVLVVENIEKPGNLGAMLRTASAAGCRAVVTVGTVVDIHNPNTIRSSTGAVFEMPVLQTDWSSIASWAEVSEFSLVGAVAEGGEPIWDADFSGSTAMVIGSEHIGLTQEASGHVSRKVTIDLVTGAVDSLNASVAAGILLFEIVRQRR